MNTTALEQRLDRLEAQAQLALDKAELQNVANKYQYFHSMVLDKYIPDLYATTVEVTRHDVGRGIYKGLDSIRRYHDPARPRYRGKAIVHAQGNPILEVAGDGETAKGLWFSSGFEGCPYVRDPDPALDPMKPGLTGPDKHGIKKYADWVWHKIGIDFIRENGQWKIWHYCYFELFRSPFDQDVIDYVLKTDIRKGKLMGLFSQISPDHPTPLSAPHDLPSPVGVCGYDITQPPSLYLREPEPYDTFANTFSY